MSPWIIKYLELYHVLAPLHSTIRLLNSEQHLIALSYKYLPFKKHLD